jgi:colanic acid/amylovoran biosynthesis glycosyltransferase
MKIIYITGCMPYGPAEAFIIDEIRELLRRNEVLVIPRSPGKLGQHAAGLVPHTRREDLLSCQVLKQALRLLFRMPRRVAASARLLLRSRSLGIGARNLAVFPKALWLATVATQWKADHIHCHWAGTTATMAMIASELSGVPWSLTAHRSDIVSNNLLTDKARSATLVRAISENGRKMMIARGIKPGDKLQVVPMGVRIPHVVHWNRTIPAVVLCPADLLEVKGHRFLIEAWKILRDRGTLAKLWLAGEGGLKSSLEAFVADLRLSDSVAFLGTMNHDDLLDLYRGGRISAVVLASVDLGGGCHEGIPVALVEAMSYSVPVIATNTGGIPELVIPGTGLLVPPENPAALGDAIQAILQDSVFAEQIGQRARRHVRETRDVARVAAELEEWFMG